MGICPPLRPDGESEMMRDFENGVEDPGEYVSHPSYAAFKAPADSQAWPAKCAPLPGAAPAGVGNLQAGAISSVKLGADGEVWGVYHCGWFRDAFYEGISLGL